MPKSQPRTKPSETRDAHPLRLSAAALALAGSSGKRHRPSAPVVRAAPSNVRREPLAMAMITPTASISSAPEWDKAATAVLPRVAVRPQQATLTLSGDPRQRNLLMGFAAFFATASMFAFVAIAIVLMR